MMPPQPVSAAATNIAGRLLWVRIPITPSPVMQPPAKMALRRGIRRGSNAAGRAPASAPSACAAPRTPIARASKPRARYRKFR